MVERKKGTELKGEAVGARERKVCGQRERRRAAWLFGSKNLPSVLFILPVFLLLPFFSPPFLVRRRVDLLCTRD